MMCCFMFGLLVGAGLLYITPEEWLPYDVDLHGHGIVALEPAVTNIYGQPFYFKCTSITSKNCVEDEVGHQMPQDSVADELPEHKKNPFIGDYHPIPLPSTLYLVVVGLLIMRKKECTTYT